MSVKEFLTQNLNPKTLFSWPAFLVTLSWGISTNLLDTVFNPEGLYIERIVGVSLAHLAMFAAIYLGVWILGFFPTLLQSLLMLPLVVAVSMFRGFTVWSIFVAFGVDAPELFNYRVFGPITNMGIPLTLTAVALHRIRSYSKSRVLLIDENTRLLKLRDTARDQVRENAEIRLAEIKETVASSLAMGKEGTPIETMTAITSTIDDVVRPLSLQIEAEASAVPEVSKPSDFKLNWKEAILGALSPRFLSPGLTALALTAAGIVFTTSFKTPAQSILLLAIIGFGSWSVLTVLKRSLTWVSEKIPPGLTRVLMFLGLIVGGLIVGTASLIVTFPTSTPFSLFLIAPYFLTGVSLLLALAASTEEQARVTNEALQETASSLAWEVTRISEEQRQMRKALSSLLHGKLQSGLTSALMKLKMSAAENPASFAQTEKSVQLELKHLLDSVRLTESSESESLGQMINRVKQTWEGIAEISLRVSEVESAEFELDPILMNSISEILPDLAFNAIKHGKATLIEFSIFKATENTVGLTCSDNGRQPEDSGRIGLGTKLLDECALQWRRQSSAQDRGTTTTVVLPFVL